MSAKIIDFQEYSKKKDAELIKQEYQEFVGLLKHLTNIQESKHEMMTIVCGNGMYGYYDDSGENITDEFMNEYVGIVPVNDINYDDLLISVLISQNPKSVVITDSHEIENEELIRTLKEIFEDRILFM